jgi:hypothetical protein
MSDEQKQAQILNEFVSKCVHLVVAYRIARDGAALRSTSTLKTSGALNTWVRKKKDDRKQNNIQQYN